MESPSSPDPRIDVARAISRDVAARHASAVDQENRFPCESFESLREAGLLGFFIPEFFGGAGGDLSTYCRIAAALGEACLSTAVTWAMHTQQITVLVDHASHQFPDLLREIAAGNHLIGAVVTEPGKGGDLMRADAPLRADGERVVVQRQAPVVSAGAEATVYLITMRAGPDRPPTDVRVVLLMKGDGGAQVVGGWDAMGMRGTRSVPMTFDTIVERDRILDAPFRCIATQSMIPVGHLGWSSAWLGAARGALERVVRLARGPRPPWTGAEAGHLGRLARLRFTLESVEALIDRNARTIDRLRAADAAAEAYEAPDVQIAINAVKVIAAEWTFRVVDELVLMCGMGRAYLKSGDAVLERVFRDLRSASLMYHDDRLLEASGRLMLIEGTPMARVWHER